MLDKNFWDFYEKKHRRSEVGGEVINQIHCQEAQACSGTSCEWERNSCSPPLSVERGKKRWDFPGTDVQGWREFSIFSVNRPHFMCYSCRSMFLNLHFANKGPTFITQREHCEIVTWSMVVQLLHPKLCLCGVWQMTWVSTVWYPKVTWRHDSKPE